VTAQGKTKTKVQELTPKQARFVQEYLIDLNATQAAIRAGYSAKTAEWQGPQLLGKTHVAQAIQEGMKRRSERTEITQDRVLKEVARLAFLDIRKAFNTDGSLKPLHELDDDTAAAIAGMDVIEIGGGEDSLSALKKIKLSDKKGALELLMRHMGMLNDKVKLQGDAENPLTVLLRQVNGTSLPVVKDADL
jgi:phage terminase small subunit